MAETVDSNKQKIGREAALDLLQGVTTLVAVRGKNVITHDLNSDRPDDETLLSLMIGPTGNLRAPTVRIGNTLMVGFNEEVYRDVLDVR